MDVTDTEPRRRLRGRRPRRNRFRLVSPTGASVVSLRQVGPRERLRVVSPSLFTVLNLFCGFSAVLLAFQGDHVWAAALLAASVALDMCDGALARLVGATTPFGVQLDSMADLISFGLAPAVLVYTWMLSDWPTLAWALAFLWLACAAFRLARFNVTVDSLADKRYFIGLPSPGAAGVPVATIFALETANIGPDMVLPVALSVLPALLMASNVRFRSFRSLLSPQGPRLPLLLALGGIAAGLAVAPGATGLVVAYGYVLTAPLGWLTAPLRKALLGPDSVAPPRTRMPSVFLPALVGVDDPEATPADA
ncbi:MAG: CDP-diacylglycerol--serine O-phosphatidyltransferase [Nocardioides sp.]|nr:CDP-diacylglycerol--serine O-phosphatidyltransferase [Nocardioides sp.]